MMKRIATLLLGLCLALVGGADAKPGELPVKDQKVVYHIDFDDRDQQVNTLRSLQNHIDAVGADAIELLVVVNGRGLSLLLEPDARPPHPADSLKANGDQQMTARIDVLRHQGVRFLVCGNSLRRRGINAEIDLHQVEPEDIVPSGIATLADLQLHGYAYIKP